MKNRMQMEQKFLQDIKKRKKNVRINFYISVKPIG